MKKLLLLITIFLLVGCQGYKSTTIPTYSNNIPRFNSPIKTVGIEYNKVEYSGSAWTFARVKPEVLSEVLLKSDFTKTVISPIKEMDEVDLFLEVSISSEADAYIISGLIKSFAIGYTLFLAEPILWFDQDFTLKGKVKIWQNMKLLGEVTATASLKEEFKMYDMYLKMEQMKEGQEYLNTVLAKELIKKIHQKIIDNGNVSEERAITTKPKLISHSIAENIKPNEIVTRLQNLGELYQKKLITIEEYKEKKIDILEEL